VVRPGRSRREQPRAQSESQNGLASENKTAAWRIIRTSPRTFMPSTSRFATASG
jgi:hypothetical protein